MAKQAMRFQRQKYFCLALGFLGLLYSSACVTTGRPPRSKTDNVSAKLVELDSNHEQGNILVMQALLDESAYASAWTLSAKLENLFEQAQKQGLLGPKTLVVLPKDIGTWIALSGAATEVYQARSQEDALKLAFGAQWTSALWPWLQSPVDDRLGYAIFINNAEASAKAYVKLMHQLARDYKVDLLAGSVVLPGPQVVAGQLKVDPKAPLQRCAFVFDRQGAIVGPPHCASLLDAQDLRRISAGPQEPGVYAVALGSVAVVQGWEAWRPEVYQQAKQAGASHVVILQNLPQRKAWSQTWPGFPPELTDLGQVSASASASHLSSYGDFFQRQGPPALARAQGFADFVVSFSHGRLWEQDLSGQALLYKGDREISGPDEGSPGLVNLWLGERPVPNDDTDVSKAEAEKTPEAKEAISEPQGKP